MFALLYRFTSWRPRLLALVALLLIVSAGVYASGIFNHLSTDNGFNAENSLSAKATDELDKAFPHTQPTALILFTTYDASLKATDPVYEASIQRMIAPLKADGAKIASYYSTGQRTFISADQQESYVAVTLPSASPEAKYKTLTDWVNDVHDPLLVAHLGGPLVADQQSSHQVETDLRLAELITLPILAILLVIIFRGVVAASLPLLLGVIAIVGGIAVVRLVTVFTTIDQYALNVITVLGLGLSVDYSLLMVNRFREELIRQPDVRSAVRQTVLTSGRTIFFSGLTVIVSLLSLTIFPIGFLRSIGLGGTSAIIVAVIAALILLPALLLLLGNGINRWQFGRGPRQPISDSASRWGRSARFVTRRPVVTILVSAIVIAIFAWPLSHVIFTTTDYRTLPAGSSAKYVAEALSHDFGSETSNITLTYHSTENPRSASGVAQMYDQTKKVMSLLPKGASVQSPTPITGSVSLQEYQSLYAQGTLPASLAGLASNDISGRTVKLIATVPGTPASGSLQNTINKLRSQPQYMVSGDAADYYDTKAAVKSRLLVAFGIIAGAMFLLLGLLLRSLVIPLQAIIINSLALLASFGVLVFVFQDGHGTSTWWLSQTGGLTLTIPLLVFAVAFGLSMDYAAFLYSRMREEYDRTGDTNEAIVRGVDRTGGIITAAAVLLFVVVAAFASSKLAFLQQVGVGLSVAVLFDAFVIRLLLVPAVMRLFGRANWYAPRWMARWQIRHD